MQWRTPLLPRWGLGRRSNPRRVRPHLDPGLLETFDEGKSRNNKRQEIHLLPMIALLCRASLGTRINNHQAPRPGSRGRNTGRSGKYAQDSLILHF